MQNIESLLQQSLKFGHINIPNSLVFWQKKYCYCIIPVVQLLPGHVLLIPKRQIYNFQDLESAEIFDISLALRFLVGNLELFFNCDSSTVHIQVTQYKIQIFKSFNKVEVDPNSINHCYIHILPRRPNDIKKNDDLYPLLEGYDKEYFQQFQYFISFMRQFNNTLGLGNAFSIKMTETLSLEAKKYKEYLDKQSNDELQV